MKARIVTNEITRGSIAKEFIKAVEDRKRVSTTMEPESLPAHQVLKVFEDHNKPVSADPAPPVKDLVKVLTHDIQGMSGLLVGDAKDIGARLFKGCHVRLLGIPDRKFVVADIFWDNEEVKIEEPGTGIGYRLPWDSVEFFDEQSHGAGWPYANSAGQQFADWVTRGSHVSVRGEHRRFSVLQILWDQESIRVRDDDGNHYVIPFGLIGPWPIEEDE